MCVCVCVCVCVRACVWDHAPPGPPGVAGPNFFTNILSTCLEELATTDLNILNLCDNSIVEVVLYGSSKYVMNQNSSILSVTLNHVLNSDRLSGPFLQKMFCSEPPPLTPKYTR